MNLAQSTLETKRCMLVKIQENNFIDIRRIYSNEKVREFLGGVPPEERIRAAFEGMVQATDDHYFIIRDKPSNDLIGLVSLDKHHDGISTEISYQLLPVWWGKGYGKEVVETVLEYAFSELGLPVIVAETQTANLASCKLLEGVGMRLRDKVFRFGAEQAIYERQKNNLMN